ncbi:PH domain-containing protein [Mammaliicoccus stepanovicii]|uniref:Membrane spanning protein n=1 Tax=Mammaliicoccus stepanovicii TaxID=643214 RepID=A0A239YNC9_9STAP|nr:PH domain-containing protein [Mammaliicoccus stepanovicii]PNZ78952.1 hypothetical protein CD111_01990 [Mammaliicoccus stepanovicii]GGI41305.1 membrane protein [Mammaliicoccus stepanovicii]SNV60701.1 membrane spanning protein [Mammaliicoccus stepanovicii]
MLPTHRMDKKGMTVERIGSLITLLIYLIILIAMFVMLKFWFVEFSKWWLMIPVVLIVVTAIYGLMIHPYYMYRNFRYSIDKDEINIKSGIFFIKEVSIPIFRIQNVDLYEGFIMRKFDLANITLSTAGGRKEIKYINKEKANIIKYTIQNRIGNE